MPRCTPDQVRSPQAYANKMLLAALQEAQSVVRSYDTKAQIVGVGYILALNLVLHFGDLLPTHAPLGPLFFAVVWGVVILPILQFGQVLYPSRTRAEKELLTKTSCGSEQRIYYVDPDSFARSRDLVHHALRSDWTSVLAAELLKTSRVRIIKQARFQRGLMMTVVSFMRTRRRAVSAEPHHRLMRNARQGRRGHRDRRRVPPRARHIPPAAKKVPTCSSRTPPEGILRGILKVSAFELIELQPSNIETSKTFW